MSKITFLILALPFVSGCAVGKVVAKSVIDVGLATCIAEHADIEDEPALRDICVWTDELSPIVKELLSARSKGVAKASKKAGVCK